MTMQLDVVTWGEALALLVADEVGPFEEVEKYTRRLAGAETNVAIGLARLGLKVGWASRVGNDAFGRFIRKRVRLSSGARWSSIRRLSVSSSTMSCGGTPAAAASRDTWSANATDARLSIETLTAIRSCNPASRQALACAIASASTTWVSASIKPCASATLMS